MLEVFSDQNRNIYRCRACGQDVGDPFDFHDCGGPTPITATVKRRPTRRDSTLTASAFRELSTCLSPTLAGKPCRNSVMTDATVDGWIDYQQVKLRPYVGKLCTRHAEKAAGIT